MIIKKTLKHLQILSAILIVSFTVAACGGSSSSKDSNDGWTGPVEPPTKINETTYEVSSAAQLAWLATQDDFDENYTYTLTADIDLSGNGWTPIGSGESLALKGDDEDDEIVGFKGTFDGKKHKIKGLKLPKRGYSGLFGYISGTSVKKAIIKDLKIELNDVSINGNIWAAGILAGGITNAKIENIYVSGRNLNITSTSKNGWDLCVGGIIGECDDNVEILRSASTINVSAKATSSPVMVGGILGTGWSTTVTACYATGNIIGESDNNYTCAGGISGSETDTIDSCYASGAITAKGRAGKYDDEEFHITAGGIFGGEYSSATKCAALNNNVTVIDSAAQAGSSAARIGNDANTNNVANSNMVLKLNGASVIPVDSSASKDGKGYALVELNEATIYTGTLGWSTSVWDFPTNGFPTLKWLAE